MATSVITPIGGGGTNLTKLTSGERFLIGIVGQTISTGYVKDSPTSVDILALPQTDLDMSNISSITIRSTAYDTVTSVEAFGTQLGPNTTKTFTPVNGVIKVFPGKISNYNTGCNLIITSFTTKDGKVHTADNLNY